METIIALVLGISLTMNVFFIAAIHLQGKKILAFKEDMNSGRAIHKE